MKSNLIAITKKLSNHRTIKIVSVILIIWFLFILPTFAAWQDTTSNQALSKILQYLNEFVSLLSRLRIGLAILAWKLMTNDMVYWSFMNMDVYLRKIRNIMKNFANFILVWLVLRSILKNLISKEKVAIQKIIIQTLIAWVLIQASWFIVWMVVDVSTIAVSAIASFPWTFIKDDATIKYDTSRMPIFNLTLTDWKITKYTTWEKTNAWQTNDYIESILPKYNSLAWPLLFIWTSTLRFQDYMNMQADSTTNKNLTINLFVKAIIIVFFSIALILIIIANIIRIWLLRFIISAIPILILARVFKIWEKSEWFFKNRVYAINTIFKPVLFVWFISIMLIFMMLIQNMLGDNTTNNEFNWVKLSTVWQDSSVIEVQDITKATIEGSMFADTVNKSKNVFADLIIFALAIFLMRKLVMLALKTWWWPIDKAMDSIWLNEKNLEKLVGSIPLIPVKWWMFGYDALTSAGKQQLQNIWAKQWRDLNPRSGWFGSLDLKWKKFLEDKILPSESRKDYYDTELLNNTQNVDKFSSKALDIAGKYEWWFSLNDPYRQRNISKLLEKRATDTDTEIGLFSWYFKWKYDATKDSAWKDYRGDKNRKKLYNVMIKKWFTAYTPSMTPIGESLVDMNTIYKK